jgi:hypothetical protein
MPLPPGAMITGDVISIFAPESGEQAGAYNMLMSDEM